jgi:hypothetical protein
MAESPAEPGAFPFPEPVPEELSAEATPAYDATSVSGTVDQPDSGYTPKSGDLRVQNLGGGGSLMYPRTAGAAGVAGGAIVAGDWSPEDFAVPAHAVEGGRAAVAALLGTSTAGAETAAMTPMKSASAATDSYQQQFKAIYTVDRGVARRHVFSLPHPMVLGLIRTSESICIMRILADGIMLWNADKYSAPGCPHDLLPGKSPLTVKHDVTIEFSHNDARHVDSETGWIVVHMKDDISGGIKMRPGIESIPMQKAPAQPRPAQSTSVVAPSRPPLLQTTPALISASHVPSKPKQELPRATPAALAPAVQPNPYASTIETCRKWGYERGRDDRKKGRAFDRDAVSHYGTAGIAGGALQPCINALMTAYNEGWMSAGPSAVPTSAMSVSGPVSDVHPFHRPDDALVRLMNYASPRGRRY